MGISGLLYKFDIGWTCLMRLLILIGHPYLSGMWFCVDPRMDSK